MPQSTNDDAKAIAELRHMVAYLITQNTAIIELLQEQRDPDTRRLPVKQPSLTHRRKEIAQ